MIERSVGEAVRSARKARGISLRDVAARLGVSPATLSGIENGHTSLTVERLHALARVLEVPASRLLRAELTADPTWPGAPDETEGGWRRFEELRLEPILDASARLFVRQGFHATSVREIAAEARVSVAGIYHHYPSKEDILVALLDLTMAEIKWRLIAARGEGSSPRDSFALMVESLALFHAVRRDLAFLGASEMRGLTEPDLGRVTGLRNEVQHLLDEQAEAAYPDAEVRVPCRAIATMCTSLPSWFRPDGPLAADQVARQYARFAVEILAGQPPVPVSMM